MVNSKTSESLRNPSGQSSWLSSMTSQSCTRNVLGDKPRLQGFGSPSRFRTCLAGICAHLCRLATLLRRSLRQRQLSSVPSLRQRRSQCSCLGRCSRCRHQQTEQSQCHRQCSSEQQSCSQPTFLSWLNWLPHYSSIWASWLCGHPCECTSIVPSARRLLVRLGMDADETMLYGKRQSTTVHACVMTQRQSRSANKCTEIGQHAGDDRRQPVLSRCVSNAHACAPSRAGLIRYHTHNKTTRNTSTVMRSLSSSHAYLSTQKPDRISEIVNEYKAIRRTQSECMATDSLCVLGLVTGNARPPYRDCGRLPSTRPIASRS